tara:strand:+ start:460 stop:654 length:195 start_codon:yes stop_codon:yes gene_type:complete
MNFEHAKVREMRKEPLVLGVATKKGNAGHSELPEVWSALNHVYQTLPGRVPVTHKQVKVQISEA